MAGRIARCDLKGGQLKYWLDHIGDPVARWQKRQWQTVTLVGWPRVVVSLIVLQTSPSGRFASVHDP